MCRRGFTTTKRGDIKTIFRLIYNNVLGILLLKIDHRLIKIEIKNGIFNFTKFH